MLSAPTRGLLAAHQPVGVFETRKTGRPRSRLRDRVDRSVFEIWLDGVELIAIDRGGGLVVAGPIAVSAWVTGRFVPALSASARAVGRQARLADERERAAVGRDGDGALIARAQLSTNRRCRDGHGRGKPKGGVGKTTSAANIGVLWAGQGRRVLIVDVDPQSALTRQLGLDAGAPSMSLVDVLAGRASATEAIVSDVHGIDIICAAAGLAGVELSLVGELGRERFLHAAFASVVAEYDEVVIDTPPNLGLLTVNALVCADMGTLIEQSAAGLLAPKSGQSRVRPPAGKGPALASALGAELWLVWHGCLEPCGSVQDLADKGGH